jgi:cation transport ATPase
MLTGDNERTARTVAQAVGIEEVLAEVLPEQKAQKIRELQAQGHRVAMVGDGINDAPALMQADVGIAIGAGTDIAIESSDVVLIGERLGGVIDAYYIGKNSYTKTKQNLAIAFSFNGIGVPLVTTGWVHPIFAMIAMVLSVSAVLANSFLGRLLKGARSGALLSLSLSLSLSTFQQPSVERSANPFHSLRTSPQDLHNFSTALPQPPGILASKGGREP